MNSSRIRRRRKPSSAKIEYDWRDSPVACEILMRPKGWMSYAACVAKAGCPSLGATYSMLYGLWRDDCYGRRVYAVDRGLRGLRIGAADIAAHGNLVMRTAQRHVQRLLQLGLASKMARKNGESVFFLETEAVDSESLNCTMLPMLVLLACGGDHATALLVAYVLKWMKCSKCRNREEAMFWHSWRRLAKGTGIKIETLRDVAQRATKLGLIDIELEGPRGRQQRRNHFGVGPKLYDALVAARSGYDAWIDGRKRCIINTRRVPARVDGWENRLRALAAKRGEYLFSPHDRCGNGDYHVFIPRATMQTDYIESGKSPF